MVQTLGNLNNNNNNNNNSGRNVDPLADIRNKLDSWFANTPIVTRCVTISSIVGWVLKLSLGSLKVATIPLFVINMYEVYRLVLSPLFEGSIFGVFMTVMFFHSTGRKLEEEIGSKELILTLGQVAFVTNVLFCFVMYLLSFASGNFSLMLNGTMGLFPTILALLIIFPPSQPVRVMFIPGAVSPKYLPLVIIGLSTLFSGNIPFDLLCAVVIGNAHIRLGSNGFSYLRNISLQGYLPTSTPAATATSTSPPPSDASSNTQNTQQESDAEKKKRMLEAAQARMNNNVQNV